MSWNLDNDRPIFLQIVEHLQNDIVSGTYQPGEKVPSVRELASQASVNPNTMQRALSELERTGLVHSERTSGRFITEDTSMIEGLKEELATEQIKAFIERMKQLGLSGAEIVKLVEKYTEKYTDK
ncbi:MAG: GntR family transcriptional regulator [Lachnospiraceae bacterium]|nr:GntR family transcriptional regulator [Lachnospiraceae bacterium]